VNAAELRGDGLELSDDGPELRPSAEGGLCAGCHPSALKRDVCVRTHVLLACLVSAEHVEVSDPDREDGCEDA
jgi:hypothetical protein